MKNLFCYLFFIFFLACSKGNQDTGLPPTDPPPDSTKNDRAILLDENFDNNTNGWKLQNAFGIDSFGLSINSGGYYLTVIGTNRGRIAYFPKKYFSNDSLKTQYAEANMWQTQGKSDVDFGFVFSGKNTKSQYNFVITSEGYYSLYSTKPNGVYDFTIIDWTYSKIIKPLPNVNTLSITKQKNQYTFYVNGQQVAQSKFTYDVPFNSVGFLVGNFKDDSTSVIVVDKVKLSESK